MERQTPLDRAILADYVIIDLQHLQNPLADESADGAPAGRTALMDYSAGAFDSPRSFSVTLSWLIR